MLLTGPPFRELTSFKVGGHADRFVTPATEEELVRAILEAAGRGEAIRALGGGKNLLVDDRGVEGTVISFARMKSVRFEGETVIAQAGAPIAGVMHRSMELGLGGLEVLAGVPGTMGGAVRMNAGGVHGNIGSVVRWVRGYTRDGRPYRFEREACGFRYRGSRLDGTFVTEVCLGLVKTDADLKARAQEILRKKWETQPLGSATAGCTFKNPDLPDRASAGRLLDRAGAKSLSRGGARYSPVHANFIENTGSATFADIDWLIEQGRSLVLDRFGVELSLEVEVWRKGRDAALAGA